MIELKITIEQKEDGSVSVRAESAAGYATVKEGWMYQAVWDAVRMVRPPHGGSYRVLLDTKATKEN